MTKESRVLLFVILLCTGILALLQYTLYTQSLGVSMHTAREVSRLAKAGETPSPTATATEEASPTASAKSKTASPSASLKPKPTETPEATEATESDE